MNEVRTRFAPSPTGYLHVGGIRTALFAWLVARHEGGKFILRFEDTDKQREVEGAGAHVIKCLRELGLDYDEGPDIDGPYGPYVQSERLAIYKAWAQKLIDKNRAYADPYTADEVQAFRLEAQDNKQPFLYRNHRPEQPPVWDGSQPLRFRSNPTEYSWHDEVMGDLHSGPEGIDDFVLIKSDGYPTYNFAHIVDDTEMKISHVMRGQEFLASVPNYLNLYEALEITQPLLATLPHVLAPGGGRKLSKRDGAKDVLEYLRSGYLPDALISFVATLGWNDGSKQELFSREELIEKFSLSRIQKGSAHFDERRLLWVNGAFIRQLPIEALYSEVSNFWPSEASQFDEDYKKQVLSLVQERLKYFAELAELSLFFFVDLPVDMRLVSEHKQLKLLSGEELKVLLTQTKSTLESSDFTVDDLTTRLNQLLEETGQKPVVLFSVIRIATTAAPASPGIAETLAVLGKERTFNRIDQWIEAF